MSKRNPQKTVIIGNGMAGARLAEEIRARDSNHSDLVMFGDEPYGNYNRILLSNVLCGAQEANSIFLNPLAWYVANEVTLHAGERVVTIDRTARTVHTANGLTETYDTLVFATGSRPFIPPIAGTDKEGVFVFRTVDDCAQIARWAENCDNAVVLGGGLLGLEAARGLLTHGVEVTVLEAAPHLMPQQLDAEGGAILARTMEGLSLQVFTSAKTTAVLGSERVEAVQLADGTTLPCDLLVIACGIRANCELARDCGLPTERGILVDDRMQTADPCVFAVGECVQHRGATYGLVAPLYEQARVLADVLTGVAPNARYTGSRSATKLKVMGVELASLGRMADAQPGDEIVSYAEPGRGVYKKLILRGDRLIAGCLLGETDTAPALLSLFEQNGDAPARRADLLFGKPSQAGGDDILTLSDDAFLCTCNQVTKSRVIEAIGQGKTSVLAIAGCTKAGTGCGGCRPLVQQCLEAYAGNLTPDPSAHWYVPGVPMAKPELVAAIKAQGLKSVSAVFQTLAGGKEDPASKPGLASLLKSLWNEQYEDERDSRFINDRVHANIQKDATFSVVPRIYGGIITPDQLRRIADAADKYDVPMVKITGGQRIDLLGVKKEDLPSMWRDLGMPSGHAYTKAFRTCKTCVGTEFCRYGVGDSTTLGVNIEKRFQGIEFPHKVKMAVSGCPRNCAEATIKDIGVVAVEGGWEIVIGGAAGSRVRAADLLARVGTHDEALRLIGRFMQYYRENARYMERTAAFVERLGIEHLRDVVVNDTEGIAKRLDAEIQAAVDAYVDPWQEAEQPVHPAQFAAPHLIPLGLVEGKRA
jgi:nitrite reductase (NADH) large subunit